MSEPIVVPSGNNQDPASGKPEGNEPPKKDFVSHESWLKLLDEKKKLKEKLDASEKERKEREEAELRAKEDFKKIGELREQEAKELREKLTQKEERERGAIKLDAFLSTLDGKVDKKYWGHINLDAIVVDPETGVVDQMSVTKEVERFRKEYFEIVQRPDQNKLPNNPPGGSAGAKITYEQWKQLPAKEMAARMKDVIQEDK